MYEVVLGVTLTCTLGEKTAYLAEVQQAGVFGLAGFDDSTAGRDARHAIARTCCSRTRARSISDLIQNGGFPPFLLQPINFEALYAEQTASRAGAAAGGRRANS